jgi:diadenosine tetraphosphate (Ap4A) HIT family hydrolase
VDSCPFCAIDQSRVTAANGHAVAFLDGFPVTAGHTLVTPRKHVSSIYELETHEQKAVWELVGAVRKRLLAGHKTDGFNIGFNDGLAAGLFLPLFSALPLPMRHRVEHATPQSSGQSVPSVVRIQRWRLR